MKLIVKVRYLSKRKKCKVFYCLFKLPVKQLDSENFKSTIKILRG